MKKDVLKQIGFTDEHIKELCEYREKRYKSFSASTKSISIITKDTTSAFIKMNPRTSSTNLHLKIK